MAVSSAAAVVEYLLLLLFFSYCKNRHTGSNNTQRIQLTSFKLVGRSGWTWKGTFYRKNLRNILLMWPLILRPFLSCVCFYFIIIIIIIITMFFFHSPLAYTHTHTYILYIYMYIYITYPLYIPFLRGIYFLPTTSKLEYILLYTHSRDARVHYTTLFCLRQIDRSFGSHHHHAIRNYNIHALLKCSWQHDTVAVDTVDYLYCGRRFTVCTYLYIFGLERTNI
jgi:hypothetical protein